MALHIDRIGIGFDLDWVWKKFELNWDWLWIGNIWKWKLNSILIKLIRFGLELVWSIIEPEGKLEGVRLILDWIKIGYDLDWIWSGKLD